MIWIETPTNPTLRLVDIAQVAEFARKRNILTVVDNTFASPWVQRPIELGADITMHSATKYLNGHSDMIGGVAVTGNNELAEKIGFLQNAVGAVSGPFDSFLALRGLKTLALRMRQSSESALRIAGWLEKHSRVAKVLYPGLASHPQHRAGEAPDAEWLQRHRHLLREGRPERSRNISSSAAGSSRSRKVWAAWKAWSIIPA